MPDSFKPMLHPDFSYQTYFIGREETPLLVIDNFIQDAQSLVDFCASNTSFNNADNYYPGVRMAAPAGYVQAVYYFLADIIDLLFAMPRESVAGGKALYSMVVTPPEQLEIKQCLPHVDSFLSGDLACVHYLCDQDKGGTSLYRHRQTGYEKLTEANMTRYQQAVIAEGALELAHKSYMNGSNQHYEQIAGVEAQFNRLVVYPSNILHSGNIAPDFAFDPNPRTGRLTLNSFIFQKR